MKPIPFDEHYRLVRKGEEFIYWHGYSLSHCRWARAAYEAYERGEVSLYQRRKPGTSLFDYCAQRLK
jgi:hypothetical protein